MKKLFYILAILGATILFIGIVISLLIEGCYNKTPQEFFDSYCKELIKK